ncbi:MAG: hypothetical protein K9L66_09380 [Spirochaetaceae bacterium]|nr:hypothetical protein [Spirochaetaceae bacterium]MCF7949443.1 hypothetical protein [Spirochaetia bacterium]
MFIRTSLYRVLILIVLLLCVGVIPSWAKKRALVQTKWSRSDGMRDGEDIYFLSSYSLYLPGKVIIPMFVVTNPRYLYSDLSLYRVSGGWDKVKKEYIQRLLEYDLVTSETRFFRDARMLGEISEILDYHHPDSLKQSEVWGRAGLQSLSEWDLPSPLEYSQNWLYSPDVCGFGRGTGYHDPALRSGR